MRARLRDAVEFAETRQRFRDVMSFYKLYFWLVGPTRHAPVPAGHRFGVGNGVFGELRIYDGDAGAPFEVADQGRAKFGVGGYPDLVGGVEEELHPSLALGFVEHLSDVVGDHDGVAAAVGFGVFFGTAEYFADEVGDMTGVIRGHLPENGTDEVILEDFIVEDPKEVLQGGFSPSPLV